MSAFSEINDVVVAGTLPAQQQQQQQRWVHLAESIRIHLSAEDFFQLISDYMALLVERLVHVSREKEEILVRS